MRVAALHVLEGSPLTPEVLGGDPVALHAGAGDLGDVRRAEDGDLGQPGRIPAVVETVGHHHVAHVELGDDVAHHGDELGFVDAHHVVRCPRRVDERSDDGEEDRLDPQRQLGEEHLEHDRVEVRCIQKADPDLFDQALPLLGRQLSSDTECLECVSAAGRG